MSQGIGNTIFSSDYLNSFEGPDSAFRGYSGLDTVYAPSTLVEGPENEPQSQIIIPSRLLLDGSSISPPSLPIAVESLASSQNHPESLVGTEEITHSQSVQSRRESGVSLESIAKRLKRSNSYIRHVHSTIRLSSTDSWRSSLSYSSIFSLSEESSELVPAESSTHRDGPEYVLRQNHLERSLVSRLFGIKRRLRDTNEFYKLDEFSAGPRRCCDPTTTAVHFQCPYCGRNSFHLMALKGQIPVVKNAIDFYGNTPLHYAGAASAVTDGVFIQMISMGANPRLVNSSGKTFLHILFSCIKLEALSTWLNLLSYLDKLGFPFAARDYHGRTIFHMLRPRHRKLPEYTYTSIKDISTAVKVARLNLCAMDNSGQTILNHLRELLSLPEDAHLPVLAPATLCPFQSIPGITKTTFVASLHHFNNDPVAWMGWINETNAHSWFDIEGNTPLLALLKQFPYIGNESVFNNTIHEMCRPATILHMRDREGETALAIAARRGLRHVVSKLLDQGASIHCKNYRGSVILRSLRKEIRAAIRNNDDLLYANLLSTAALLADKGALQGANDYLEWALPYSPMARHLGLGDGKYLAEQGLA